MYILKVYGKEEYISVTEATLCTTTIQKYAKIYGNDAREQKKSIERKYGMELEVIEIWG